MEHNKLFFLKFKEFISISSTFFRNKVEKPLSSSFFQLEEIGFFRKKPNPALNVCICTK